jgi:hypothetical protein
VKVHCSMFSQVRELIERTKSVLKRKKDSADHLGNAPSTRSRFLAMLFSDLGRAHCRHENKDPSNHVGFFVILNSAGMHDI